MIKGWLGVSALIILSGTLAACNVTVQDDAKSKQAGGVACSNYTIDQFYQVPAEFSGQPGDLIRCQSVKSSVPSAEVYRILYQSADTAGKPVAVSGFAVIPTSSSGRSRDVVAWAHPTLGQADKCAPSRGGDPLKGVTAWISKAVSQGWIVAASDYSGLGMPGDKTYLVGQREGRDVTYSALAAAQLPAANASKKVAFLGHSQGGHSTAFALNLAAELAPDLEVVGASMLAPPLDMSATATSFWNTAVGWVIGANVYPSWKAAYPSVDVTGGISAAGQKAEPKLLAQCLTGLGLAAEGHIRLKQFFFAEDPNVSAPSILASETPSQPDSKYPMFIAAGLSDTTIPPLPTKAVVAKWCDKNTIQAEWPTGETHMTIVAALADEFIAWIKGRFDGLPAPNNCS